MGPQLDRLLETVTSNGRHDHLVAVVDALLHPDPAFAGAVSRTMGSALRHCNAAELARLGETVRHRGWNWHEPDGSIEARHAAAARVRQRASGWSTPTLGLIAAHWNGYVREAAVDALAERPEPVALAPLLIRCNDWVDAVRDRAMAGVRAWLDRGDGGAFLASLELVRGLARGRRDDHAALVDAIERLVATADDGVWLRHGLADGSRDDRRHLARIAARLADRSACATLAWDTDAIVSLVAVRVLLADEDDAAACRWSRRLAGHRSPAVREAALRTACARCPDGLHERLLSSLEDPARSIRWAAAHFARAHFGIEAREIYLERLPNRTGRALATVTLGLGDVGRPEDAERLAPLLDNPAPRVRAAALVALAALDPDAHPGAFDRALASTSAFESRTAASILAKRGASAHLLRLQGLMDHGAPPHVRRNLLHVALRASKWPALAVFLRAATIDDPELRERTRTALDAWLAKFNRSFVPPTEAEVRDLTTALEQATPHLGVERARTLRRLLTDAGTSAP